MPAEPNSCKNDLCTNSIYCISAQEKKKWDGAGHWISVPVSGKDPGCKSRAALLNQYSKNLPRASHTVFIKVEGTEGTFRYTESCSFSKEVELILLSETF